MTTPSVPSNRLAIDGGQPAAGRPVPFMSTALTGQDIESAIAVLRSGMLRQAARCSELEERFGALSDAQHAITCANGTCALHLAYLALLEPGDEVIVPAWTFLATASMIVARGCTPVFCDVLPDTYQIDPADVQRRITPRTRAIACTHLYGCPVDIDAIEAIARRHNLKIIYDAAQAHLARYRGRGLGSFGDAVTYSFYATKNLATGEGGMVTTRDADLARRIRLLRSHGETGRYVHESIGFNFRMNDITAAIGCSRLDRLQTQTRRRQEVAERYDRILAGIDAIDPPGVTPGAEPAWHLYTARLDPDRFTCTRDEFCEALKAEGVPTAVHYPRSLTRQPCFAPWVSEHMPTCDWLAERVFCLPMHPDLTDEHLAGVETALKKVARAYRLAEPVTIPSRAKAAT